MPLTPLPDPPQTADPANFATKADALVAALATMVSEINGGGITFNGGTLTTSPLDASVSTFALLATPTTVTAFAGATTLTIGNVGGTAAFLGKISSAVANAGGLTQEAVVAPTLLNSWVNYGDPYEVAGYYKDSLGVVHLRGLIKDGTTTPGTTLFTLPSGYRPAKTQIFAAQENSLFAAVQIEADGDVQIVAGSNTSLSLSGISF